jgi:hypothetical protein
MIQALLPCFGDSFVSVLEFTEFSASQLLLCFSPTSSPPSAALQACDGVQSEPESLEGPAAVVLL